MGRARRTLRMALSETLRRILRKTLNKALLRTLRRILKKTLKENSDEDYGRGF